MMKTKAIYNLLRLDSGELEDLRQLPADELFARLKKFRIQLNKETFLEFATSCDTPEDLNDLLIPEEMSDEEEDTLYLLLFELWRRFLPEKPSLSVFGDELDYRISLYDEGNLENDELIQDGLANLLAVLEENSELGANLQEVFTLIGDYSAHDLESFIYEYISNLLDDGNSLYSAELIEGFSPYVTEPIWFDLLRARLLAFTEPNEANEAVKRLLSQEMELDLLLEIIRFLSTNGNQKIVALAVKKALPLLSTEEELQDLMMLLLNYYNKLDDEKMELKIQAMIDQRPEGPVNPQDLSILETLI